MPPIAYNDLPASTLDYLTGFEIMDAYAQALTLAGLPSDDHTILRRLVDDIVTKDIELSLVPGFLAARMKIPQEQANKLAVGLAGYVLLPIAQAIGDVEGAIRSWGGDMATFAKVARIELPEYSVEGFVKKAIENLGTSVSAEVDRDRLEFLLTSYARRVHTRGQTLESLMRDKKVGGLEWAADESERVLAAFDVSVKSAPAELFGEPAKPAMSIPSAVLRPPTLPPKPIAMAVAAPKPPAPTPLPPKPPVPAPSAKPAAALPSLEQELADLLEAGERAEQAAKAKNIPPPSAKPVSVPKLPAPPTKPLPSLDQELKDLLEAGDRAEMVAHAAKAKKVEAAAPILTGLPKVISDLVDSAGLKDEETRKRLERIVDARLKDVRDAFGTRAEIEKPANAGGVGLSGRALVELMERIEAAVDARRGETDERAGREKTEMIQRNLSRGGAENAVRAKEEQLLARRYAELTGKAPTEPIGALAIRTSVAISAEQSVSRAAARLDNDKVQRAVEATRPAKPAPAAARPQMADVIPPRRLTGPVDELRSLTLTDFRRLSRDAKSAATKVIDKVDLLGEQGYDQRVAGVRAWRESPLYRWYAACAREALSRGVGVPVLLAEKHKAGEEVPTEAEVAAILSLNGQLRF